VLFFFVVGGETQTVIQARKQNAAVSVTGFHLEKYEGGRS
jgi:hypothetical protein